MGLSTMEQDSMVLSQEDVTEQNSTIDLQEDIAEQFKQAVLTGDVITARQLLPSLDFIKSKICLISLLLIASKKDLESSVAFLLSETEVDINGKNQRGGYTALHLACLFGSDNVVVVLLRNSATTVNVKNNRGLTPLYLACEQYSLTEDSEKKKKFRNIISMLRSVGATKFHMSKYSKVDEYMEKVHEYMENAPEWTIAQFTIFSGFCQNSELDSAKKLLSNSPVVIWQKNSIRCLMNILYTAAEGGHVGIIQLLLESKIISINAYSNRLKQTALHFACRNVQQSTVEMLLAAGIESDTLDFMGITPLYHACDIFLTASCGSETKQRCSTIIEMLLSHGAKASTVENKDYFDTIILAIKEKEIALAKEMKDPSITDKPQSLFSTVNSSATTSGTDAPSSSPQSRC